MSRSLTHKQWVPITDDEREELHREAERREITTGLLARALLLDGLDRAGTDAIDRRVAAEKAATRRRISEGARAAARSRWGQSDEGGAR